MTLEREKELLYNIQADPGKFAILFDAYYKPVFGYIYRRVVQYEVAKDIAAETFLKAYLNIRTFRWKGASLLAWIYKIATNEVNSYFRKKRSMPGAFQNVLNLDVTKLITADGWEDEKAILDEELKQHREFMLIQEKLKLLDTKYQEVIAFRYFEQKNIREISEILRKPEGTVKSLLSRGLERLRNLIYK